MNELWLFLPAIIILGIASSYTDLKYRKIRNRHIAYAFAYGALTYVFLFFFLYFSAGNHINPLYFAEILSNLAIASLVGFGFWNWHIWSAGDAKLFMAFAFLIPPSAYGTLRTAWFPSIALLVNIFAVGTFAVFILVIRKSRLRHYRKSAVDTAKRIFALKKLASTILSIFVFTWVSSFALSLIGAGESRILRYASTLLLLKLVPSAIKKYAGEKASLFQIMLFSVFACVRIFTDSSVYTSSFWIEMVAITFTWRIASGFFRGGIMKLGSDTFSKSTKTGKLKECDVLASPIFSKEGKLTEKELELVKKEEGDAHFNGKKSFSTVAGIGEPYIKSTLDGLSKSDILKIKKTGLKRIRISSLFSFALIMFIGVLITITVKGNILIVLFNP